MCGIAGYYNLSNSQFTIDESLLEAMQNSMQHRGPDGYRVWTSYEQQCALVHRRLSIVDLSAAGFQPMHDKEQTVVVCCNGEIYNHQALKKELESYGHIYSSNSDSETVLHAYKQWGISFLDRLEGMFAIVIVDRRRNELYLVRDRMGVKPLYFSMQQGIVSFASEIKALWHLPWLDKRLHREALFHYLTYMVTPAPMTLYEGVYKLPSSFYMKVDAHRSVSFHEWYFPLRPKVYYTQKELQSEQFCIEEIRSLLRASVKKRMIADVPVGVFLSGGIDSSLNTALMAELSDQVKTFTVSFKDGPEYSEVEWARKVSQRFMTDHHEVEIDERDAFNFFTSMVWHQDEPIADCVCIPLYYVSRLLKDSGVTVVHVGEGSDELFCGYSTYARYIDLYNRYWRPSQRWIPASMRQTAFKVGAPLLSSRLYYADLLKNWGQDRHLFWSGAMAFPQTWKERLMVDGNQQYSDDPIVQKIYQGLRASIDSYAIVDYHYQQFKQRTGDDDFFRSMTYLELKQRLPELLLMRVDKMTMATSVEGRVPFLDHALVEFVLQIPTSLKYKDGVTKYILKKACEGILPNDVIYRKKMGFAAPTMRWFKEGAYFRPYFKELLNSKRSSLAEFVDVQAIEQMFEKNQQGAMECSLQLWVLQNVMANDAL